MATPSENRSMMGLLAIILVVVGVIAVVYLMTQRKEPEEVMTEPIPSITVEDNRTDTSAPAPTITPPDINIETPEQPAPQPAPAEPAPEPAPAQ